MRGIMAVLILMCVLALGLLSCCFLAFYDDYCYWKKRQKQFERLMQKCFLIQADSLETYQAMLHVAFREKGTKKKDGKKDHDV